MRITARSDYAIRAVFDLAYHTGGGSATAEEVAGRQKISQRFLEQIFLKLRNSGVITSKRGPAGGYRLLKSPKEISLYDIIACVEGPIELVLCVSGEDEPESGCGMQGECVARFFWKEIGEKISSILKETSIEDLCLKAERKGLERASSARLTYEI
ncbi:Rrf2 family transcriptional regulator [bacterium]|nr:MAG: Rrf2 family transcriptional regulator [bacterium]